MWMKTCLLVVVSIIYQVSGEIEGISLPDVMHVNGVELRRNGQGVRSFSVFGMNMKIYVAGMYSPKPLLSAEEVYAHDEGPMQFDFTFLRSVGRRNVMTAWTKQLEWSVSHKYDGYEKDRDEFLDMMAGSIEHGGTQTVQLIGDDTVVVDQGVHKGAIEGRDFQKSFLSMWFGERAVAEDLKEGLLKGVAHRKPEHGVVEAPVVAVAANLIDSMLSDVTHQQPEPTVAELPVAVAQDLIEGMMSAAASQRPAVGGTVGMKEVIRDGVAHRQSAVAVAS